MSKVLIVAVRGRDGLQYVWLQELLQVFSPTAWPLARFVARQLLEQAPDDAEKIIKNYEHARSLVVFEPAPILIEFNGKRNPEVRSLVGDEQETFLRELRFNVGDLVRVRQQTSSF